MNLKPLLTPQYWFSVNSAFIDPKEKLFFLIGIVLVLLGIVLKISAVLAVSPVDRKYRNKFYKLFLTIGLMQAVWFLCRYENIAFFNTQFVAWLIALAGIIWLIVILVKTFKNYGKEKSDWEKEQVKLKYLPK